MASLTTHGAGAALQALAPNGTARWVGLLSTLPVDAADDGTELDAAGYTRVEHAAWEDVVVGTDVRRRNVGTIELPELEEGATALGWALYDAAVDGNLLAWGALLDEADEAVAVELDIGDVPRFLAGDIELRAVL